MTRFVIVEKVNKRWRWIISSEKQSNGLWGMPLQCVYLDMMASGLSQKNRLKHSAFCIAIAESHLDETFRIWMSDGSGFYVTLSKSGSKRLNYDDYSLNGDVLTWIGNATS